MGFPTDFFPVLFAIPRVTGWLAHWRESLQENNPKIWRPRQIYTGEPRRPYVPMESRDGTSNDDSSTNVSKIYQITRLLIINYLDLSVPINVHPYNRRYTIAMRSRI